MRIPEISDTMILLLPILWLVIWAVISVAGDAVPGLLAGTKMLETAAEIFVCGGLLLPLTGWLAFRCAHPARQD